MNISSYKKSSSEEISQLFSSVFTDSEGPKEGLLIGNLVLDLINRTDDQDIYGFVAYDDEKIMGSIFFTRLIFESAVTAFILSPVAIDTGYQGQGVGQKMINFGITYLKEKGVSLLFTYGDPRFYSKVGFGCVAEKTARAPMPLTQPEGWLCQSLFGHEIKPIAGSSRCVDALNKPEYW